MFGGLYANPGGMFEDQDATEVWEDSHKLTKKYYAYRDLDLRISWLRELYEECSILPAYKNNEYTLITEEQLKTSDYDTKSFALFCRENNIFPAVDKLYGFRRIAPPHTFKGKRIDQQIYLYFVENDEDKHIKLNPSELVEESWVSPIEALQDYYEDKKKFWFPQAINMFWLTQFNTYDSLKTLAMKNMDKIMSTYMEYRANVFMNNPKLINEKSRYKTMDKYYEFIFNKHDFLSDWERSKQHDLMILNNSHDLNEFNGSEEVKDYSDADGDKIFK
jgi:8-oxo-dGTP pyrophosphatase MutT (NUDIX family)